MNRHSKTMLSQTAMFYFLAFNSSNALTLWRNEGIWKAMFATPGPILPKICDWMLNYNDESHTRSVKLLGIIFNFLHFVIELKHYRREWIKQKILTASPSPHTVSPRSTVNRKTLRAIKKGFQDRAKATEGDMYSTRGIKRVLGE